MWHGIYRPEWDNRLGLPVVRPRFSTMPVSHRPGGEIVRSYRTGASTVYVVRYISYPFLVVRCALPVATAPAEGRIDHALGYVNSLTNESWVEVPVFGPPAPAVELPRFGARCA